MSKRLQFALSLPELTSGPGAESARVVLYGKSDGLYYRGSAGAEVGPLAAAGSGGGGAPANMVTTDTDQTITGTKTWVADQAITGSMTFTGPNVQMRLDAYGFRLQGEMPSPGDDGEAGFSLNPVSDAGAVRQVPVNAFHAPDGAYGFEVRAPLYEQLTVGPAGRARVYSANNPPPAPADVVTLDTQQTVTGAKTLTEPLTVEDPSFVPTEQNQTAPVDVLRARLTSWGLGLDENANAVYGPVTPAQFSSLRLNYGQFGASQNTSEYWSFGNDSSTDGGVVVASSFSAYNACAVGYPHPEPGSGMGPQAYMSTSRNAGYLELGTADATPTFQGGPPEIYMYGSTWSNGAQQYYEVSLQPRVAGGLKVSGPIYEGLDRVYSAANPPSLPSNAVTTDTQQTVTGAKNFTGGLQSDSADVVVTTDARLSDTRTPTAHVHAAADVTSGTLATDRLGSGTASSSTFLRGDNTWATPTAAAPANMATTDTTQTITGQKNFTGGLQANGVAAVVTTDARLSDARTPLAHTQAASTISDSTATGRSVLTAADAAAARTAIGAGTSSFSGAYSALSGTPATFAPSAHAASHASGGADAVTLAQSQVTNLVTDLAAKAPTTRLVSAGTGLTGGGDLSADRTLTVAYGTAAGTAAQGDDARLSDARTPTAHVHAAADVTSGVLATARLGSGTANTTTFLRGDNTWATPTAAAPSNMATTDTTQTITGQKDFTGGLQANGVATVVTTDARLSDARAPLAHTQTASTISDSTAVGRAVLTAVDAPAARTAIGAGTSSFDGAYASLTGKPTLGTAAAANTGTGATEVVLGGDARLSDARTPTTHTHAAADVASGVLATARLGSGTPSTANWLRGDGAWTALTAAAVSDSTATGRSVLTAADAAAARTAIGAGTSSFSGAYSALSGIPATFAPTAHVHSAADVSSGTLATARLGSGTASSSTFLRGDNTWATVTAAAPPNMVTTDTLQSITGAKDFTAPVIMPELDLLTDFVDLQPDPPATGLSVFARYRARRLLATVGPSGEDTAYQPGLFSNRIARWNAVNNTTAPTVDGLAVTNVVAPTAVQNATTNYYTAMVRNRLSSATTAGAGGGLRSASAQWFLSNTANLGGFFFVARFGLAVTQTTSRVFVGLSATTGALPNSNPTTWTNTVGFGCDTGLTTLRFMHNSGTGTATSIDLGANYPSQTAATWFYEARMFVSSGNASLLRWSILRLNDGVLTQGAVSANLPVVGTLMSAHVWQNNGTTAAAVSTDLQSLYIETDN